MKHISIFLFTIVLSTLGYGQLSIHSIDFQAPLGGSLNHNNTLNLGVTLKMPEKSNMLEISLLGFGDNGTRYDWPTGSNQMISYFDSASNTFTSNDRARYRLNYGDSILKQYQSTSRNALGIRIGIRKDFTRIRIPFYTSVSVGLIGANTRYTRGETYEVFDSAITNLGDPNFGKFESSFPFDNLEQENKFSFIPQLSAQLGVVLSLNNRIKVVPKLSANITYGEYFAYNLAGATSSFRSFDLSTAASFQISYLLRT